MVSRPVGISGGYALLLGIPQLRNQVADVREGEGVRGGSKGCVERQLAVGQLTLLEERCQAVLLHHQYVAWRGQRTAVVAAVVKSLEGNLGCQQ